MLGSPNSPLSMAARKAKTAVGVAVVFAFGISVLSLANPLYLLQIYDRVVTGRSTQTLLLLSVFAIAAILVMTTLESLKGRLLFRAGSKLSGELRASTFQTLMRTSAQGLAVRNTQALRDLDALRAFFASPAIVAYFDAPWVVLYVLILCLFHPFFALMTVAGAVILFGLAVLTEMRTAPLQKEASNVAIRLSMLAESAVRNAEVSQAMGMEGPLVARWTKSAEHAVNLQTRAADVGSKLSGYGRFVRAALQIGNLGIGAYLVIDGKITTGTIMASSILLGRALQTVEAVVTSWKHLINARIAWQRLDKFLLLAGDARAQHRLSPAGRGAVQR